MAGPTLRLSVVEASSHRCAQFRQFQLDRLLLFVALTMVPYSLSRDPDNRRVQELQLEINDAYPDCHGLQHWLFVSTQPSSNSSIHPKFALCYAFTSINHPWSTHLAILCAAVLAPRCKSDHTVSMLPL